MVRGAEVKYLVTSQPMKMQKCEQRDGKTHGRAMKMGEEAITHEPTQ